MTLNPIKEAKDKMNSSITFFEEEIKSLRTSKANTSIFENIKVDYYNTPTPLIQLASINSPDAESIIIDPFDKNSVKDIEKAIYDSDLNLTPTIESDKIRVKIPPLTKERREELLDILNQKGEQAKISIRSIREDAQNSIKNMESNKDITEDEKFNSIEELNNLTNESVDKIESSRSSKEEELTSM